MMKKVLFIVFFTVTFYNFCNATAIEKKDSIYTLEIGDLIQLSMDSFRIGNFRAAHRIASETLLKTEEYFGRQDSLYGITLNVLGLFSRRLGDDDTALKLYLEAREILEKSVGTENARYSSLLNNLARLYGDRGDMDKALPLYLESLDILEKTVGTTHPQYGLGLNNLGMYYSNTEEFDLAIKYLKKAIEHAKTYLGPEHQAYSGRIYNLGNTLIRAGQDLEGLRLLEESAAVTSEYLGEDHPSFGIRLNGLAIGYRNTGRSEEAIDLLKKAMVLAEKHYGINHREYLIRKINLALTYRQIAQYGQSLKLNYDCIQILENAGRNKGPIYQKLCHDIAQTYLSLGNLEKAGLYFTKALQSSKSQQWTDSPADYNIQKSMINYYLITKDYEAAESTINEVLDYFHKSHGETHQKYLSIMSRKGRLLMEIKNYPEAAIILEEVYESCEDLYEIDPLNCLGFHYQLGMVYFHLGQYNRAYDLIKNALTDIKEQIGVYHNFYTTFLSGLLQVTESMGRIDESDQLLEDLIEAMKLSLLKQSTYLSESEREKKLFSFTAYANSLYSIMQYRMENNLPLNNLPILAYDYELFIKGYLLQMTKSIFDLKSISDFSNEKIQTYRGLQRLLAIEYEKEEVDAEEISNLRKRINYLERELAGLLGDYRNKFNQLSWSEIQLNLASGEKAIEFITFQQGFPKKEGGIWYGALIISPGSESPVFKILFSEDQIENLLTRNPAENEIDYIHRLYGYSSSSLYDFVWNPLDLSLDEVDKVYYSPSGFLNQINLNAISHNGQYFIGEKYNLIRLHSTRDLAKPRIDISPKSITLFGGIQYDIGSSLKEIQDSVKFKAAEFHEPYLEHLRSNHPEGWNYLPASKTEVVNIAAILEPMGGKIKLLTGLEATEKSFKNLHENSTAVIHLATHGFFLPNKGRYTEDSNTDLVGISNPLFQSGLVFANANKLKEQSPFSPESENGLLSAFEIANLDLSNTKLVVLSACETGLGEIKGNEGVYGLHRAFRMAGVDHLLMSLWKVPDQQTQELMELFYIEWMGGIPLRDAFRNAQLDMAEKYPPYYWAGFVLMGGGSDQIVYAQTSSHQSVWFIAGFILFLILFVWFLYWRKSFQSRRG